MPLSSSSQSPRSFRPRRPSQSAMVEAEVGLSLIKKLAACHGPTRDKAVRTIFKSWLPAQTDVPEDDMKKLWKGLFYCVWHADKFPVQADLAEKLSSVIPELHPSVSLQYFSTFLLTMRREWTGIDRLRLDKFYLLIRRFLHYFFDVMRKCSWDLEFTRRLMGVLVESTFLANDNLVGAGVNYHVASVFLEELRPFLPLKEEVVEVLLGDFVVVMGKVGDKLLVTKLKSCIFYELVISGQRLLEVRKSGGETDQSDDVGVLGSIALVLKFSAKFYEVGSSQDCYQANRKALLQLHEAFLKLEKDLGSSGIEVVIPELNGIEGEDAIKLVPMDQDIEMDTSGEASGAEKAEATVPLKNNKKSKLLSGGSGKKGKKGKASGRANGVPDIDNQMPNGAESRGLKECVNGDTVVLNDLDSSGIKVVIPEVNDIGGEDAVELIPMDQDIEMDTAAEALRAEKADVSVSSKNSKKSKKLSGGSGKKGKKGKASGLVNGIPYIDNLMPTGGESRGLKECVDGDAIVFNESVVSNLQSQFEKIAAESGLENDVPSACDDVPTVAVNGGNITKKRKRSKNKRGQQHEDAKQTSEGHGGGDGTVTATAEKSAKRVKFAMKDNLVWKPHTPLPPQSLRLPPTATPRGSALKKGVPPGPIAEMPLPTKKVKRKSKSPKKARKKVVRVAKIPSRKKKLKSVV